MPSKKIIPILMAIAISVFNAMPQTPGRPACAHKKTRQISRFLKDIEVRELSKDAQESNLAKDPIMVISGRCHFGGGGCPVSLVKPMYPEIAEKLRLPSIAEVEILVDEDGNPIYSRMEKGIRFFKKAVETAACESKFTQARVGGNPVKVRILIRYIFQ